MFEDNIVKNFNEIEHRVFEYVISNLKTVPFMTIRELSSAVGVSTTSVLRFVRKSGYQNYNEFKFSLKQDHLKESMRENSYDFAEAIDCLNKLSLPYYVEKYDDAARYIDNSTNIVFLGVGNSGTICHYGARRFTSAGKFAMPINDPYLQLRGLNRDTLIIVLSVSGETKEIINSVVSCKQLGCKIMAITTSEQCTLAKLADVSISYYINKNGRKHFDMTSQIPVIGIIENLAQCV